MHFFLPALAFFGAASAQFLISAPLPYQIQGQPIVKAVQQPISYAHPSVVANSLREAELPIELSKSHKFYSDPRIAAGLAKSSWFGDLEMPVLEREAEKIPREQVYKIFKNAGYVNRR